MGDLKNINSMLDEIKKVLADARGRTAVQIKIDSLLEYRADYRRA